MKEFSEGALKQLTDSLKQVLGTTYVLYVKTQNFHWNIESSDFFALHKLFEEQYEELAEAIDEIAERLRIFPSKAPGKMEEFLSLSLLRESGPSLNDQEMLRQLYEDHTTISDFLLKKIQEAQKFGDEGTADLYIQRVRAHDKFAWMLKSHLPS